ncbi:MAG TPA: glutathione transferase GstA, partial [Gammaproteobacteria bacterium]|nr:glutathione transferase GstA [Gammaproteobacteria bacterium]
MKLYFSPGACSMAPHIVLRESGYTFDLEKVDLAKKQTASGEDYTQINPKGYVPALRLDNGEVLTEVAVTLQYLADQKPESGLAPKPATMERYRLMEWLNFVSSEIHKQFSPLFNPKITQEWKENQLDLLSRRFDYLTEKLKGKPYLMGEQFTVADAYLFTVLNWSHLFKVDLGKWPRLQDYIASVAARSAVKEAMSAEELR